MSRPEDTIDSLAGLHQVVVYSTPTCPWCTRAKAYLRERGVAFRDVDVSQDRAAAFDLVRRTHQFGVPVIEIDGQMIVGFDRPAIDRALGLGGAGTVSGLLN